MGLTCVVALKLLHAVFSSRFWHIWDTCFCITDVLYQSSDCRLTVILIFQIFPCIFVHNFVGFVTTLGNVSYFVLHLKCSWILINSFCIESPFKYWKQKMSDCQMFWSSRCYVHLRLHSLKMYWDLQWSSLQLVLQHDMLQKLMQADGGWETR